MKHRIIILLVLCYIVLSAFLEAGFGGRVVIADLFLVLLMIIAFTSVIGSGRLQISSIHLSVVPLLLVFLIGTVLAISIDQAAFELLILTFNVVGAVALVSLLTNLPEASLSLFFRGYVLVLGVLSFICILDFIAMPGLISSRNLGGLQGPFRNTGQAGSFFGVHCALAISLIVSRLVPRRPVYIIATTMILFALIFTLKRASTIAIAVGLIVFVIMLFSSGSTRDKKIGLGLSLGILILGALGYLLFQWGLDLVPGMRWRFETKISADALDSFTGGFMAENINSALQAFGDHPLFGVGLGNVHGVYQHHEIHSTYLGILAYGGTLGILTYMAFMGTLFVAIYRESKYKLLNAWSSFLYMLLPLLVGQMIGWAYTLHIRKREFWLLTVFVVLAISMSKKIRQNQSLR